MGMTALLGLVGLLDMGDIMIAVVRSTREAWPEGEQGEKCSTTVAILSAENITSKTCAFVMVCGSWLDAEKREGYHTSPS